MSPEITQKQPGYNPEALSWTSKEQEQFKSLCAIWCSETEVCQVMQVSKRELHNLINKYFRKEVSGSVKKSISFDDAWEYYSSAGKLSLRRLQLHLAEEGSVSMAIFLGKCYLGQSEKMSENALAKAEEEKPKQDQSTQNLIKFMQNSKVKKARSA